MNRTTMMVWSLTQSQILACEIKWALGSITTNKTSGGEGIPAEIFQILKYDTVKVLHSICQQIWKTQQRSVFIPIPKKGNAKECSNYHTVVLISHASKVMPKIFQARFQLYVNQELLDIYKLDLEKAEEPEIKLLTSIGSQKKQGNSKKKITSASLTTLKPLTVRIMTNCGKLLKRRKYQTTLPAS